jgi:hypothetical protein
MFKRLFAVDNEGSLTKERKVNIDNLTFGELKQIAAMFAGQQSTAKPANPVVGEYCIARCYSAGVHAGEVVSVDGENVVLKDSRRLWSWKAQDGIALSGVAQHGIKSECKIDVSNPVIYLTGVCELIPCTKKAKESINA